MPYQTNYEARGIFWEVYGNVTREELYAIHEEGSEALVNSSFQYLLMDITEAEYVQVNETDLFNFAADNIKVSEHAPVLRIAAVVQDEIHRKLSFKYMEMGWKLNLPWEIRIFKTLEEARDWLSHIPQESSEKPKPKKVK